MRKVAKQDSGTDLLTIAQAYGMYDIYSKQIILN